MGLLSFRGCFINLDQNQQRLALMTRQLADAGLAEAYERAPAVNGFTLGPEYKTNLDRGSLGLWLTHERLVAAHQSRDLHLHILEDDALIPIDAAHSFSVLLEAADRTTPDWEIIFTDMLFKPDTVLQRSLSRAMEIYRQTRELCLTSLKRVPFSCMSSFFVNRKSVEKYLNLLSGRWREGKPIDLHVRSLIMAGKLASYVCLPFATSISSESDRSDIRGDLDISRAVMNLYRRSIYKDADLKSLREEFDRLTAGLEVSDFDEFFLQITRFFLSSRFAAF